VIARALYDHARRRALWLVPAVALWLPAPAAAQVPTTEWQRGSTLSVFGGAATASSSTDPGFGGSMGWELTPRLSIEGRALWLVADSGPDAFSALLGTRFALRASRPFVPVVTASAGVYHAAFDVRSTTIPDFYQRRIDELMAAGGPRSSYTFNDFSLQVGGGFDIFLTEHLVFRPELSLLLATDGSDSRPQALYGVQFAYHFEPHPVR
jgi:Outer membrane protein beta-barrel domain